MLQNWEKLDDLSVEDLMRFIQGPDFPTGGLIVQDTHEDDLNAAYGTGRGRVTVQARCHIEEISRGRNRIIVTELPYMTNKSSLIERIAELARGKTGRVYGHLMALLTTMKGIPLSYDRDMQEDKPGFFDCVDTLLATLDVATGMLETIKFKPEK
jgi:DNA gyrase/topoisomerase IV subunit A